MAARPPGTGCHSRGHGRSRVAVAAALALPLALAGGCAGYSPDGIPAGSSSTEVIARMGPPKARFVTPSGGERLEFWRGPFGKHTFMVDFDAQNRMLGWEQVLTEANFYALRHGMTKDEVLYRIGHPSEFQFLTWPQQHLWSYRYVSPFCVWFQVSLDTQDQVVSLGNNNDPICTVKF